jgi:hypothetical protein
LVCIKPVNVSLRNESFEKNDPPPFDVEKSVTEPGAEKDI